MGEHVAAQVAHHPAVLCEQVSMTHCLCHRNARRYFKLIVAASLLESGSRARLFRVASEVASGMPRTVVHFGCSRCYVECMTVDVQSYGVLLLLFLLCLWLSLPDTNARSRFLRAFIWGNPMLYVVCGWMSESRTLGGRSRRLWLGRFGARRTEVTVTTATADLIVCCVCMVMITLLQLAIRWQGHLREHDR